MSAASHPLRAALIVGLGAMGLAMASRLNSQGWEVVGVDPDQRALDRALTRGVRAHLQLSTALGGERPFSLTLTSLPNDDVVSSVVEELSRQAAQLCPPLLVETSTILPSTVISASAQLSPDVQVIDVALSGGPDQVATGTLISYIAGPIDERPADVSTLLTDLCDRTVDCPSLGDAKLVKILNNTMGWASIVLGAEVVAAGQAHGLHPEWLVNALSMGNGRSHQFNKRFARLMNGDRTPYFSLAMGQKDARLAMAVADEIDAPARMTAALLTSLDDVDDTELLRADIVEYYTHYLARLTSTEKTTH